MSNWRPNFNPDNLYFVTTKAVDYIHIFEREVAKRLLLDALDSFRLRERMKLYCFVIMPNHVHFIARFPDAYPLSTLLRDFKKQTADRLVRQLKAEGESDNLRLLASKVPRPEKQVFKVWEDGYNAKDIFSEAFLTQKMDYIHNNPCQPHWNLCAKPENYLWSSARFYLYDEPGIIPIDDVRKI